MKFRKKPIVIEACRFEGWSDNKTDASVNSWPEGWSTKDWRRESYNSPLSANDSLIIPTLEGAMAASRGDWIIRGIKGEFYPCNPEIFEATYERVE